MTRQARERHRAGLREVHHRSASSGKVENLGPEMDARQVILRPLRAPREKGGMSAGVAKIEEIVFLIVMAHVGKEHRVARHVFEQLHGERAVHIGFGGANHRLLGTVKIVRVVGEGVDDVFRGEVVSQLRLGLDAEEVDGFLPVDFQAGVITADLPAQELGREFFAVVMNVGAQHLLQPGEGVLHPVLFHQLRAPDDLVLIDVLDVDAEVAFPLVGIGHGGVHAHRTPAVKAEGLTLQAAHGHCSAQESLHFSEHCVIAYVAVDARVVPRHLVHAARRREHPHHAGIAWMVIGKHQVGPGCEFGGNQGEMRKAPDGVVQDGGFDTRCEQASPFALRDLRVPDDFFAGHHLVLTGALQPGAKPVVEVQVHLPLHFVGELAAV